MRVEVLHVRDPDDACTVQVWVDGAPVPEGEVAVEDIDPGRGWQLEDWDAAAIDATNADDASDGFRSASSEAWQRWRDKAEAWST